MSKLGNALLEATQDDMAIGTEMSDDAKLITKMIEQAETGRNVTEADDAAIFIGWCLHDMNAALDSLDRFRDDLSAYKKEVEQIATKALTLAKSLR